MCRNKKASISIHVTVIVFDFDKKLRLALLSLQSSRVVVGTFIIASLEEALASTSIDFSPALLELEYLSSRQQVHTSKSQNSYSYTCLLVTVW